MKDVYERTSITSKQKFGAASVLQVGSSADVLAPVTLRRTARGTLLLNFNSSYPIPPRAATNSSTQAAVFVR